MKWHKKTREKQLRSSSQAAGPAPGRIRPLPFISDFVEQLPHRLSASREGREVLATLRYDIQRGLAPFGHICWK